MQVFRLHIRPNGGQASVAKTFKYCLSNNILGIGWRAGSLSSTTDWKTYYEEASNIHGSLSACVYIKDNVHAGDLIWTRDNKGHYYLARVTSGWEYFMTPEATEADIDIANVVRCQIISIPLDAVPGKVIACFRPSRTLQRIADKSTKEYSKFLWNLHSGSASYETDKGKVSDIFSLLDDEETEDLIFFYLQSKGWYVAPNSRKGDTMNYEFLLVRPDTGEVAATQVKTGHSHINLAKFAGAGHKVYTFQPNGLYSGDVASNIVQISRAEATEFLDASANWLPGNIRHKMSMVQQLV